MKVSSQTKLTPEEFVRVVYTETVDIPIKLLQDMWVDAHYHVTPIPPFPYVGDQQGDADRVAILVLETLSEMGTVGSCLWELDLLGDNQWEADVTYHGGGE